MKDMEDLKNNKKITLKEARKLLGKKYAKQSDDVIERLIEQLEYLSQIALGFP